MYYFKNSRLYFEKLFWLVVNHIYFLNLVVKLKSSWQLFISVYLSNVLLPIKTITIIIVIIKLLYIPSKIESRFWYISLSIGTYSYINHTPTSSFELSMCCVMPSSRSLMARRTPSFHDLLSFPLFLLPVEEYPNILIGHLASNNNILSRWPRTNQFNPRFFTLPTTKILYVSFEIFNKYLLPV